ncbi:hypothetical protein IFM89_032656, partial [Coptis chinensis]
IKLIVCFHFLGCFSGAYSSGMRGIAWALDSPPKGLLLFSCWQFGVEVANWLTCS